MKNIFKIFLIIFGIILTSNFVYAQDDSYTGIGVYLDQNRQIGSYPIVSKVVDNSPASMFRLQRGDKITSVDTIDTTRMSNEEVTKRLRGPIDSQVTIIIQNNRGTRVCIITRNRVSETDPAAPPLLWGNEYSSDPYYTHPLYWNPAYDDYYDVRVKQYK